MPSINFENFTGLAPAAHYTDKPGLIKQRGGQFTNSVIDPNRIPGVLSPFPLSQPLTNASTITTKVTKMVNFITDSPLIFGIGGAKFYEIVPSTDTITNTGNFPHTIDHSHTSESLSDVVVYENNGAFEVFYSFNDDTDGDIGRLSAIPATDTFDDDYFTAVVGGSALNKLHPHPLAVGDNNICYFGNGSVLGSMDLRTGTPASTDSEIDLFGGWIIKKHITHKGFHWIAARETHSTTAAEGAIDTRQPGRTAIFVWDYQSSNFSEIYYMDDSDVYSIFLHQGELHVITGTGSTATKLRKFNGTAFVPVPNGILRNRQTPTIGGVGQRFDLIIWGAQEDGSVFSYGSLDPSIKSEFNVIGDVGADMSAIIQKPVATDTFYISSDSQVEKHVFTAAGGYKTDTARFRSGRVDFPQHVQITGFKVYFPNISGTGDANEALELEVYFNGTEDNSIIGTIGGDKISKGVEYFGYNQNDVYSIQVGFNYNGSNVSVGDPTILPYKIEVIYEPTGKRG